MVIWFQIIRSCSNVYTYAENHTDILKHILQRKLLQPVFTLLFGQLCMWYMVRVLMILFGKFHATKQKIL